MTPMKMTHTKMTHTQTVKLFAAAFAAGLAALATAAQAAPFTATVFATGAAVSGTSPDSLTVGGGHVFVEYGNGASSSKVLGTGGASTIAEYDLSGNVLNTFSVLGSADGVRYNSTTNQLWVLQNQDGNSALTIIDPNTSAKTKYTFDSGYDPAAGRGFDDAQFLGGKTYLSESNPAGTDPIIVQATLGAGTVSLTPVLADTFGNSTVADPDSLDQTPGGDLLLTGGDDGALTTVHNPGAGQTTSFLGLKDAAGKPVSGLDDVAFAGSGLQTLLVADTANNTVYALNGPFTLGTAYASVGSLHSVDTVNLTTGAVTSITDGVLLATASPHGLAFLSAPAVPEASTTVSFGLLLALGLGGVMVAAKKRKQA